MENAGSHKLSAPNRRALTRFLGHKILTAIPPVVQRIEHEPSKLGIEVRFLTGGNKNMIHKYLAGGVVLNVHKEVAVVQQGDGISKSFSLPKGHIEEGETPLDAAQREITEETGLEKLTLIKKLGTYQRHPIAKDAQFEKKDTLNTYTFFLFTTADEILKPRDPENPRAAWMKKEDVAAALTHPKDKEFFLSIMNTL